MSSFASSIVGQSLSGVTLVSGLVNPSQKASIGPLELDASLEEQHSHRARVTRHPAEDGSDINDHVIQEPDSLRITGQVSNHPVERDLSTFSDPSFGRRADTFYEELLRLKEEAEVLTVVTTLRTYEDFVIETLDIPRNVQLGNTVRFSASLVPWRTVKTGRVQAQEVNTEVDRVKPKRSRGKQATKPASDEQASSFLSNATGYGG